MFVQKVVKAHGFDAFLFVGGYVGGLFSAAASAVFAFEADVVGEGDVFKPQDDDHLKVKVDYI